ncbi:MAG: SemiSWEET transporter [Bacteroidales bacterium]|nr:SemiSWEET transporter [Bacteroidales bacterium]
MIGLIAATLTTFAFLPQAIQIIKTKHTHDISLVMYVIITLGISLWLIYGIMIQSLPIILANSVSVIFTGVILIMKIKYK